MRMIEKTTNGDPESLNDQVKQDVFVLNLERAIQACIDMANVIIAHQGLMMPSSYRQVFHTLYAAKILGLETAEKMKKMAGFRNIAIHDYRELDLEILKSILKKNLTDLEEFCREIHRVKIS